MKETGNLPFEQAAKVRLAKELLPPPPPPHVLDFTGPLSPFSRHTHCSNLENTLSAICRTLIRSSTFRCETHRLDMPANAVAHAASMSPLPSADAQDLLIVQDVMDTLDQIPPELTRVHSDLNELGAVLYCRYSLTFNCLPFSVPAIMPGNAMRAKLKHRMQRPS